MKIVRERRGISLGTLASELGSAKSHLSKVEHGHSQASPDLANRIAKYFGNEVTRDQILFPEDYPANGKKHSRSVAAEGTA